VIDLPAVLETTTSGLDVTLKDGDELIIPPKPQSVTIIGSVNYPTSHFYDPSLDPEDYIELSGGILRRGDKENIYIVRANGRVESLQRSRFFPKNSQPVFAGDTIVVPIDINQMKPLKYWGSVSQIIYQLALGAAAVQAF
jgi:protein involved in polysaccharide export with SLBB domain